jgi:hypothetical protein
VLADERRYLDRGVPVEGGLYGSLLQEPFGPDPSIRHGLWRDPFVTRTPWIGSLRNSVRTSPDRRQPGLARFSSGVVCCTGRPSPPRYPAAEPDPRCSGRFRLRADRKLLDRARARLAGRAGPRVSERALLSVVASGCFRQLVVPIQDGSGCWKPCHAWLRLVTSSVRECTHEPA